MRIKPCLNALKYVNSPETLDVIILKMHLYKFWLWLQALEGGEKIVLSEDLFDLRVHPHALQ